VGAKAGSLTIMVGGSQASFDAVMPLFEMMGKNISLIGEVGAGQVCKVANQVIVAATIEAVGDVRLRSSRITRSVRKLHRNVCLARNR